MAQLSPSEQAAYRRDGYVIPSWRLDAAWVARLQDALRGAGHSVVDTTVAGGHDRIWWAARFADGVADLLAT